MNISNDIDSYLRKRKVTADTKITLALLIELLDGYSKENPKIQPKETESDAVEFAEWLTDNGIISFFSKVTFSYYYNQFKLFKNKK